MESLSSSEGQTDVFVSYSHSDEKEALLTIRWLESQGVSVWYDAGIRPGEEWRDELAQAIEKARICLYFVSPRSVDSPNCRKEVHFALSLGKNLLAMHLEQTILPAGLELAMSDIQAILAYQHERDVVHQRLLESVRRLTGPVSGGANLPSIRHYTHAPLVTAHAVAAVLPFENLGDKETLYFSDGLSEEIINGLTRHGGVTVISRASSFRFRNSELDIPDIGKRLGASHMVTGSLHTYGDKLILSVELVHVASNTLLWSERYERSRDDAFSVQSLITQEIIGALDLTESQEDRTTVDVLPAAYDAFLEARHCYNRNDFDAAVLRAERAIELDPKFSDAYAILADMHAMKVWYWFSSLHKELPSIVYYSNLARSLRPASRLVEGQDLTLKFFVDHQYAEALAAVRELGQTNPVSHALHSMHSVFLMSLRDFDGAVAELDKVIAGDPLASAQHRLRAERLTLAGRYEEARETLDHTARIGMPDPMQYGYLAFMQGDVDGLSAQLPSLESALGENHIYCRVSQARLKFLHEDYQGAGEVLVEVEKLAREWNFQYMLALIAQLTGRLDDYLTHMEEGLRIGEFTAYQNYTLGGIWQARYPDLEQSTGYQGMLKRLGLDDATVNIMLGKS